MVICVLLPPQSPMAHCVVNACPLAPLELQLAGLARLLLLPLDEELRPAPARCGSGR